jgi:hypothetical protein
MATTAVQVKAKTKSRLNLNLSETARKDVEELARQSDRSITETVRLALSLLKIVLEERRDGNKFIVTTADGRPLKELVIPAF